MKNEKFSEIKKRLKKIRKKANNDSKREGFSKSTEELDKTFQSIVDLSNEALQYLKDIK